MVFFVFLWSFRPFWAIYCYKCYHWTFLARPKMWFAPSFLVKLSLPDKLPIPTCNFVSKFKNYHNENPLEKNRSSSQTFLRERIELLGTSAYGGYRKSWYFCSKSIFNLVGWLVCCWSDILHRHNHVVGITRWKSFCWKTNSILLFLWAMQRVFSHDPMIMFILKQLFHSISSYMDYS